MKKEKALFDQIIKNVVLKYPDTCEGKMMSSPGIKYKDKVFAFYYKKEMVFRLGEEFSPLAYCIKNPRLLNPFKNKPPLKAWFIIDYSQNDRWEELSLLAYDFVKTLK